MIFNELRARNDLEMKLYISYLEIYNEQGYDLLNSSQKVTALEDLPKVTMLEDEHGNFHLKNLTVHPVTTEVEALDLLFYGDTNRAVAETPMNLVRLRLITSSFSDSTSSTSSLYRHHHDHIVSLPSQLKCVMQVMIVLEDQNFILLIWLEVRELGKLTLLVLF